jgi:hypothetical protein
LADFEQFGWVVSATYGEADKWQTMIPRLSAAQAGFAMEGDALVPVLRKLLESGDVAEQKTSAFYELVQGTARDLELDMEIPFSAAALTERIGELQEGLEVVLDIRIRMRTLQGYRLIQIARGPSWQGAAIGLSEVSEVRQESTSSLLENRGYPGMRNVPTNCPPIPPPLREAKPTPPTGESIAKAWPGLRD